MNRYWIAYAITFEKTLKRGITSFYFYPRRSVRITAELCGNNRFLSFYNFLHAFKSKLPKRKRALVVRSSDSYARENRHGSQHCSRKIFNDCDRWKEQAMLLQPGYQLGPGIKQLFQPEHLSKHKAQRYNFKKACYSAHNGWALRQQPDSFLLQISACF